MRQLLVEARLALGDLLHRLDRECAVDSQQGHLDRREARGHRGGGLLQRRDSGGLDLLDHHLVGRQARIGAFERKGPTFQQPELVLQFTQPCLGGHVGRVRCRSLLRYVLPGLFEKRPRHCSIDGEAGEVRAVRLLEALQRLQFAEQRLHFLGQFALQADHLVGQRLRPDRDQLADLLHELAKGVLGLAAGELGEQAGEEPRVFALLDLLQYFRQLGVIDTFFQAPEESEHLGRRLFVEPGEEAVEGLLQRLFGTEADLDDVAGWNVREVQRGKRLLGLRHLLRPEHDGSGLQGILHEGALPWRGRWHYGRGDVAFH